MLLIALALQAAVPPPAPPAPAVTTQPLLARDPLAHLIKARAPVVWEGQPANAELLIEGAGALVRMNVPGRAPVDLVFVDNSDAALAVLADRRLAPLWPALLEWAGDDLSALRQRALEQALRAYNTRRAPLPARNTGDSLVDAEARALMDYVAALKAGGKSDAAIALLDARLTLIDGDPSDKAAFERSQLESRRAGLLRHLGDHAAGVAASASAESRMGAGSPYALNFAVTRASWLAFDGRHGEALDLIERAEREFVAQQPDEESYKIAGSNRQFAWIRACALHGIGRRAEALTSLEPVSKAKREPIDERAVVDANDSIRERAALCMGDDAALARQLLAKLSAGETFADPLYLTLQQGHDPVSAGSRTSATRKALKGNAAVRAALKGRMRELPAIFRPALNGWGATYR